MNWKIQVHCRVRNESIGYIAFIDRNKPDNSVRINPATRHSETKYGFVILTGDMIFKDFFVRVKFLLEGRKQKRRLKLTTKLYNRDRGVLQHYPPGSGQARIYGY